MAHTIVTGATGGIGSACVSALRDLGHQVSAWDLPHVDVTDPEAVHAALENAIAEHSSIGVDKLRALTQRTDPTLSVTGPHVNFRPFTPTFRCGSATGTLTTLSVGPLEDIEIIFQSARGGALEIIVMARGVYRSFAVQAHADRLAHVLIQAAELAAQPGFDPAAEDFGTVHCVLPEEFQQVTRDFNDTEHELPGHRSLREIDSAFLTFSVSALTCLFWPLSCDVIVNAETCEPCCTALCIAGALEFQNPAGLNAWRCGLEFALTDLALGLHPGDRHSAFRSFDCTGRGSRNDGGPGGDDCCGQERRNGTLTSNAAGVERLHGRC